MNATMRIGTPKNQSQEGERSPIRRKANGRRECEGSPGSRMVADSKEGKGLPVQRNAKGHQEDEWLPRSRMVAGSKECEGLLLSLICDGWLLTELHRRRFELHR